MEAFFSRQLDYIYFFYGLSFIVLSIVCFELRKTEKTKLPFSWLGMFGITHAFNEWMDLISVSLGDNRLFSIIRIVVLAVSFLFLLEFGRKGICLLTNRCFTIWIYLPFILLGLSGSFYGLPGLNATIRYFIGLPAGVSSAITIYLISKQDKKYFSNLFLLSVFLFIYSLATGLVVPKSDFYPAIIFNYDTFLSIFKFPVQLVRAIAALLSAMCIFYYSRYVFEKEFELTRHDSVYRKFSKAIVFLIIGIVVVGWFITEWTGNYANSILTRENKQGVNFIREHVYNELIKVDEVAVAISGSPWISPALISLQQNDIENANSVLDRYNTSFDMTVCYLLNKDGMVIASSNRNTEFSFVGYNFSFRPYFANAISGGIGHYFALGEITRKCGYYAGAPVFDSDKKIIGVVVIKKDADALMKYFGYSEYSFLLDPNGIVFAAGNTNLVLKSLWPVSEEIQKELLASRQFGDERIVSVMSEAIQDGDYIQFKGEKFYVGRSSLRGDGWTVALFSASKLISDYRLFIIAIILVLCIVVIMFLAFLRQEEILRGTALKLVALAKEQNFIFEHTKDFIYRHDVNGIFTYLSPSVKSITGRVPEEWKEHYSKYLTDNPINKKVMEYTGITLATGKDFGSYEVEIRHKDGRKIMLEVSEQAYFENSKIAGIVGVARDITDRINFEKELKEKVHALEIFQKVAVDRELKMVELKNKIAELEGRAK
jgi:PAS domain S-box-containing protein